MSERMRARATAGLAVLAVTAGEAHAIDHGNLDEGRPLRLEDAYPISAGEIASEAGAGVTVPRRGRARGFFLLDTGLAAIVSARPESR